MMMGLSAFVGDALQCQLSILADVSYNPVLPVSIGRFAPKCCT